MCCTTWSWVPQWDSDCAAADVPDRISAVLGILNYNLLNFYM